MTEIAEKEASEVLQTLLSVERIESTTTSTNNHPSSQHWHTPEFDLISAAGNKDAENSDDVL